MATIVCDNGHHYDNRRHTYCPYCPIPGLRDVKIRDVKILGTEAAPSSRPLTLSAEPTSIFRRLAAPWLGDRDTGPHLRRGTDRIHAPIRVFISSTFRDLEAYREAASNALHSLGVFGEDMIFWSADERSPFELSISKVKSCDLMILVLAHRYGFIPKDSAYSIVESEYYAAREANIPVHGFFVNGKTPWPPDDIEWDQKENLDRFKDIVRNDITPRTFSSPDELKLLITQAISNFRDRNRELLRKRAKFSSSAIVATLAIKVKTDPNVTLEIGVAEDGLPLLLRIRRGRDLRPHLDSLFQIINPRRRCISCLLR